MKWCVLDCIARCEPARDCESCPLWSECRGEAKSATGFLPVDDVVRMRERSSDSTWASELMCRRPQRSSCVYERFDAMVGGKHVVGDVWGGRGCGVQGAGSGVGKGIGNGELGIGNWGGEGTVERRASARARTDARARGLEPRCLLPASRTLATNGAGSLRKSPRGLAEASHDEPALWVAGIDPGMRSPFVWVWGRVDALEPGGRVTSGRDALLTIVDEYKGTDLPLEEHVARVMARAKRKGWPDVAWAAIDPAAAGRNAQTGLSDADVLRQYGVRPRWRRTTVTEGIELVKRRLDRDLLKVSWKCLDTIESLAMYHYDPNRPHDLSPVKDGYDHVADAVRYLVTCLDSWGKVTVRKY